MTYASHNFQPVELADELTAELEAGAAMAGAFYSTGRRTLVASFSTSELAAWDGSEEKALISDPDGIDLPDESQQDKAA